MPNVLAQDVCDASLPGLFDADGAEMDFARCASRAFPEVDVFLPLVSRSTMRNVWCAQSTERAMGPHPPHASSLFPPVLWSAVLGVWATVGCVAVLSVAWRVGCGKTARRLARHSWAILAWWTVLLALSLPLSAQRARHTDMYDFYVRDEHTRCAFDILRAHPRAVVSDRILTVLAESTADMRRLLHSEILHTEVRNTTLASMCGFCGLQCMSRTVAWSPELSRDVILDDGRDSADPVMCSVVFPETADRAWRADLARRLARVDDLAFSSFAQFETDLNASVSSNDALVMLSTLALMTVTYAALRNVRLTCACVFWLLAAIGISDAAGAALGIPFSPWNVLVAPFALGVGSDAMFILKHHFLLGGTGWVARAFPSLLASYATTVATFAVALSVPIPNLQRFFLSCIVCMTVLLAMQYTLFPVCIRKCVDASVPHPTPRVPRRVFAVAAAFALTLAAGATACARGRLTLTSTFDMTGQLLPQTRSHRVMQFARSIQTDTRAPVYAYFDLGRGDLRATVDSIVSTTVDAQPFLDWTYEFPDASHLETADAVAAWMSDPFNRVRYAPLVGEHTAVAVYTAPYRLESATDADARFVASLPHAPGACAASFERLGAYTLSKMLRSIALMCATSVLLTGVCAAILVGRARAGTVVAAVALAYATLGVAICVLRVNVTLMVASCLILLPGLVCDFALHLTYDPHTLPSVVFTALSSGASMLPYALLSPILGVRDFALVYTLAIVLGLVYAAASVREDDYAKVHGDH